MKVLITGATGLIGKELSALLLKNGIDVHYLSTSQKKLEDTPNYKGFYWNPDKGIIDTDAIKGVDVIVHLAGANIAKRWTKGYKQEIIDSRIKSAELLLKTMKDFQHDIKQVVSASAIGIYKDSQTLIHKENCTEYDNSFLSDVVQQWEASTDNFMKMGIKVCKLRTGLVLSTKGGALPELTRPINCGLGAVMGNGKQWQSWIHIQDLVETYFFAINNSLEGIYNAVAPNPVSNQELVTSIARILRKPLIFPGIPRFALNIALGEMHQLLFASQKVDSQKMRSAGFEFKFQTLDQALVEIL